MKAWKAEDLWLQANRIWFLNQIFWEDYPALLFASDQIGFVSPDITNLSAWVAVVTT